MQLTLTVISGGRGKTTFLHNTQSATVGREASAGVDLVIENDPRISRQHFRIAPRDGAYQIEDLKSRHGTFINGKRKAACILRTGDEIKAGGTVFKVEIEGDDPEAAEAKNTTWDMDGEESHVVRARKGQLGLPFTCETCESGVTMHQGKFEKLKPSDLVQDLRQSRRFIPWLIADGRKLGAPLPPTLMESSIPIVDWLGGPEMAQSFPMLIPLAERPKEQWKDVIDEGWDQDAVMAVFTKSADTAVAGHWRAMAKGPRGGLVGVVWPSVLTSMLAHNSAGPKLLETLTAVLTEVPDLEGHWRLWSHKSLERQLVETFGFLPPPERPTKA